MTRDFPTPRHLDEPLRVWGLTIAQWVGVCVAAVCTYGAWLVVGPAGPWVVPFPRYGAWDYASSARAW